MLQISSKAPLCAAVIPSFIEPQLVGGGWGGSITAEPTKVESSRQSAKDKINTLKCAKCVPIEAWLHD